VSIFFRVEPNVNTSTGAMWEAQLVWHPPLPSDISPETAEPNVATVLTLRCADGKQDVSIGRIGADVCVDPKVQSVVSKKHATVYWASGEFHIQDNASMNGTFVNGTRIRLRILKDGDHLIFGGGSNIAFDEAMSPEQCANTSLREWVFHVISAPNPPPPLQRHSSSPSSSQEFRRSRVAGATPPPPRSPKLGHGPASPPGMHHPPSLSLPLDGSQRSSIGAVVPPSEIQLAQEAHAGEDGPLVEHPPAVKSSGPPADVDNPKIPVLSLIPVTGLVTATAGQSTSAEDEWLITSDSATSSQQFDEVPEGEGDLANVLDLPINALSQVDQSQYLIGGDSFIDVDEDDEPEDAGDAIDCAGEPNHAAHAAASSSSSSSLMFPESVFKLHDSSIDAETPLEDAPSKRRRRSLCQSTPSKDTNHQRTPESKEFQYAEPQRVSPKALFPTSSASSPIPNPGGWVFNGIPAQSIMSVHIGSAKVPASGKMEFTPTHWKLLVGNPNLGGGDNIRLLVAVANIQWYKDHTNRKPFFWVVRLTQLLPGVDPFYFDPECEGRKSTVSFECKTKEQILELREQLFSNYAEHLQPHARGSISDKEVYDFF